MKKRSKLIISILIVLAAIVIAAYFGINAYLSSLIEKTEVEEINREEVIVIVDETPKAHDVVNFMLVGADNLDWGNREESYVEQRSDVFKLVSLDYTDKKIKLTSLDRDIVVWIPDKGGVGAFGRFNWAYSFGGAKYAFNCVNYNLDLNVDKYVSFSFAGFIHVIDILDGIDIELTDAEYEAFSGNGSTNAIMHNPIKPGSNHLDGYDALAYARQRYLDSDFNRMERQNKVIKAVISKLKNSSFSELYSIVIECLPYITTNLETEEIKTYLFDVLSFDLNNIETHTYPTNGTKDVCWNKDSLGGYLLRSYSNQVIDLHKYIYGTEDYVPSQTIYDLEKKTYETYGDFYENSELIP